MKRILSVVLAALIVAFTLHTVHQVNQNNQVIRLKAIQLKNTQLELNKLQQNYEQLNNDKTKTEQQKQQKIDELEKERQRLEAELQARREIKATETKVYAAAAPTAVAVVAGCGDNQYAQYIYQHESGCNLNAVNAGGCRGIGQACPGSKLPCGADYACQNAFFTQYAISRYGSWEAAYSHWLQNRWW